MVSPRYKKIYDFLIIILSVFSILLVILDFSTIIHLSQYPYRFFDELILGIFTADYVIRWFFAPNKKDFFVHNIFDLIAILPFDALFSFFRIARILRITRVSRLSHLGRLVGITGKMTNRLSDFLKINGFINVLYTSFILIILSSLTFAYAENVSLPESLWWAFVTATTVGYGDVAPHTVLGKFAAILLMFLGIGFISLLTSTITEYFNRNTIHEQTEMDEKIDLLLQKIDNLEKQVSELKKDKTAKK